MLHLPDWTRSSCPSTSASVRQNFGVRRRALPADAARRRVHRPAGLRPAAARARSTTRKSRSPSRSATRPLIAIENVRLFNETKEALERQTATAEVLQVISSSVQNTAPVFEKILDSCERLFATPHLGIMRRSATTGMVHAAAVRGDVVRTMTRTLPRPIDESATGRAITRASASSGSTTRWPGSHQRLGARDRRRRRQFLGRVGADDLGGPRHRHDPAWRASRPVP